ncbi:MAG: xylulokinase [Actinobacteria bacterium]|nr:xylulokinase [Actinomycetota bacterium]
MKLVAGVDSSTQSVKVVIRNAETGELVRQGRASHPEGTEVNPIHWWEALNIAFAEAGGLEDVAAISIAGQQHGMIALDYRGEIIRDALLWNDTRSASAAVDLVSEIGGEAETARAVGSVLVASFTVTKLRWVADNEPGNAARIAAVALPHDWLSWKLSGSSEIMDLFTDRSDASGTGYFDPTTSRYNMEIFNMAIRNSDKERKFVLPKIISPDQFGGKTSGGILIGAGAGDNAAAALGLMAAPGDVVVSLGTSGTAFAISPIPTQDSHGEVAGFADASGLFLPLVCTLNAARILDSVAKILNVSHEELGELALAAPAGAGGLTMLPYFEGERTPNRPFATGTLTGLNIANSTPRNYARAMIEGMLCGLADAIDSLVREGVEVRRIFLIGGAAKNPAVSTIASAIFGREILLPPVGEYVADGAARQAAWALSGLSNPPDWDIGSVEKVKSEPTPQVLNNYRKLRDQTKNW